PFRQRPPAMRTNIVERKRGSLNHGDADGLLPYRKFLGTAFCRQLRTVAQLSPLTHSFSGFLFCFRSVVPVLRGYPWTAAMTVLPRMIKSHQPTTMKAALLRLTLATVAQPTINRTTTQIVN